MLLAVALPAKLTSLVAQVVAAPVVVVVDLVEVVGRTFIKRALPLLFNRQQTLNFSVNKTIATI